MTASATPKNYTTLTDVTRCPSRRARKQTAPMGSVEHVFRLSVKLDGDQRRRKPPTKGQRPLLRTRSFPIAVSRPSPVSPQVISVRSGRGISGAAGAA